VGHALTAPFDAEAVGTFVGAGHGAPLHEQTARDEAVWGQGCGMRKLLRENRLYFI